MESDGPATGGALERTASGTLVPGTGAPGRKIGRARWRHVEPLAPVLAVAIALVLVGSLMAATLHYTRLSDFARIGARFGRHIGVQQLAVSDLGYDGQFFYYLAIRPEIIVTCPQTAATCPLDEPPERTQRILYPMVVRVVALGQPALVPLALLLVDFVAVLVTVAVVGQLCVEAGASRWLGAAAGLFAGEVLGTLGDLSDPFAGMWVVLAVWLARKERPLASALAVAAALLTREQLIFVLPLLALPLILRRRWRALAASAAIALAPFVAWQVVLRLLYGKWTILVSLTQQQIAVGQTSQVLNGGQTPAPGANASGLVPIPFAGLWANYGQPQFWAVVVLVGVPVAATLLLAAVRLVLLARVDWRAILRDPVPLMAFTYCLLLSLTSYLEWNDPFSAGRLAIVGIVLGVPAACYLPRVPRGAYAVVLAAFAVVAAGVAVVRLI